MFKLNKINLCSWIFKL